MSRQSKNARLFAAARERSAARVRGEKGPAYTTSKHGKVNRAGKAQRQM